ncbi:RNA-dependent RNA polymerase [Hop trefoil cryptic virus 2]|uniref:RNA-dependent RNA polymerase n=1 Tax=Hop trefoil cryptic virus 2 TaxID=1323523 RepID=M9VXY5_9VIRU|nr:RNA-dependent RNA polymerase [Hop trefoil cryptic virus 2]AGJ83767.1 RNA-dependent RNA polymerase [Hop trefoil cryptic virus 2]
MPFNSVRNYLEERSVRVKKEMMTYQSSNRDPDAILEQSQDPDYRRYYDNARYNPSNDLKYRMLSKEYSTLVEAYRLRNDDKHQPYELHQPVPQDAAPVPSYRAPAPGIKPVPLMYHYGHVIHDPVSLTESAIDDDSDTLPDSDEPTVTHFGYPINKRIYDLICNRYPEYLSVISAYCRPIGTVDATFKDFNKEQIPSGPIDPNRKEEVLTHIFRFLDAQPYLPLHFVDTQFCKTPLVTGTGYHNRYSFKQKAHAKYSHPEEYAQMPTSKGYFYNATYENARTLVHYIKEYGLPFNIHYTPEDVDFTEEQIQAYIDSANNFFNDYPTLLFTRNHISKRDGTLKVRPVYAVDDLFIIIELMLTFPLTVQARKQSCCIMYGLETIRGSNHYIERLARSYSTYFSLDWSSYDQRLPRVITDIYYTDFLRRLIVINDGYQPTYEYPTYPDLDEHKMYTRMDNLLTFLHTWYNNMTFVLADGYAYRRTYCGVPSGLYNTQYLDSFGNLFLIIDAMIEFGFRTPEIDDFILLVLGDDNTGMTVISIDRIYDFITFLEIYALTRYNMVLSTTKSVLTTLRSKIETLGYQCNHGSPKRDISKLIAQLCYPENGLKPHTMASRAIGIAYASAGQDYMFHSFCQDVYNMFRLDYKPDARTTLNFQRQIYHNLDDGIPDLATPVVPPFPSIFEVREMYSRYQGPLTYAPKWNFAHFINSPDVTPAHYKTMRMYEIENNITIRPAPTFETVVPTTRNFP